jgi:hypothetical protein
MNWQSIVRLAILLLLLVTCSCAGMNTYQSSGAGGPDMMGCGGDRPSEFPPYCHPSH